MPRIFDNASLQLRSAQHETCGLADRTDSSVGYPNRCELGRLYGLTDEEPDVIINHDIKHRRGQEANDG